MDNERTAVITIGDEEFSEEKAKRFLSKVVVTMFTVTFVFYNGAKITRTYDNGQPGNKVGWNKKKEES